MARSRCRCGVQLLWKADETESDEWLLIRPSDLPEDVSEISGVAEHAAICSNCGRIWVAWQGSDPPAEYALVDSPDGS